MTRHRSRGFTLVELMVTVAIIALLATFLAPSVSRYMDREHGKDAAREVADLLRRARNQAMSRGEVIVATVTTGDAADNGETVVLERTDSDASNCDATTDEQRKTTRDPDCYARSCAQAQGLDRRQVSKLDLGEQFPDMTIAGTDPAANADDELELCFEPGGRVLGANGLPLESSDDDCAGVNTRIFVRQKSDGSDSSANPLDDSAASLTKCLKKTASDDDRQLQKDGRDVANFFSIHIPFNGSVSTEQ